MPLINEYQLNKTIKDGKLKSCYLFYGNEVGSISEVLAKITDNIDSATKNFNLTKFSLESCTIEDLKSSIVQVPLLSERRFTILNGQIADKIQKGTVKEICELLSDIPSSTTLILSFLEPSNNPKKSSNLRELIKFFSKYGDVCEFSKWSTNKTVDFVVNYLKEEGVEIERELAFEIADRTQSTILSLKNELDKLISKSQNSKITKEDIELLTFQNIESTSFELATSILKGDGKGALLILDRLLKAQEEPLSILGALNLTFIDLFRAKCIEIDGGKLEDITAFYNYKGKEFRLKKSLGYTKIFSIKKIKYCLGLLKEADISCKTTTNDKQFTLQKTIILMIKGNV